ncbi:Negative regulator of mitotic exit [Tulasnella sp. 424]|nr:Negative regulator of mitotic exit [Tulasnella sp. 424]
MLGRALGWLVETLTLDFPIIDDQAQPEDLQATRVTSRSTEPRHGASSPRSSRKGRPKTSVEDTTGHGSKSGSPARTIDEVTTPQEILTSEGFTVTPRNTSHSTEQPEVNSDVPYALTWTEHDLELKNVKAQENSGSKSDSNSSDISSTADDDSGHITHGAFPRAEHSSMDRYPNPDTNDVFLLSTTDWSLTSLEANGTKPEVRKSHRAVIAGRVLVVFGGTEKDNYLHFLKLDTREWSKFRPPGPYPGPRKGHSFIIVDNTIWLYGGVKAPDRLDDMWCLDLGNDGIEQVRWRRIPKKDPWPQARAFHSTVYYDGSLYLFGGWVLQKTLNNLNDLWRFEISAETWTKVQYHGQAPQPRNGHTATVISDNMFIFGGVLKAIAETWSDQADDVFVFNLQGILACLSPRDSWTLKGPLF